MIRNTASPGRKRVRVASLVLLSLLLATTTALASELFGFKLNAGVGSTQSLLQ